MLCDTTVKSDKDETHYQCKYQAKYWVITQAEILTPANEYTGPLWTNLSNSVCSIHLKSTIDRLIRITKESETRGRHSNGVIVTHL